MNIKLVDGAQCMRLPRKPPSDEELGKVLSAKTQVGTIDELKPYMDIVNSKYLHWDELWMRFKTKEIDLELLWGYVNITRQFNSRSIAINGLVLRYVQTPQIEKTLHNIDMQIGDKIELDVQIPSPNLKKKYLVNSLMEEAIASSQLEGAVTTRAFAKKMLQENRKPRNESERMIVNNYFTMKYVKEQMQLKRPLTLELIKEIHKKVTEGTLKDKSYEGNFREDNEVKVVSKDEGQILHNPPDHKEIEKLLKSVCDFANSESTDYYMHPLVKAIVLHYMVGYVHPFNDGNGRTARALFYWYALSQKYDYLEYIAVSTAIKNAPIKYNMAYLYSESDHNDITYFVKFNLRALAIAIDSFKQYIDKTRSENKKIIETIRYDQKLNFRQADVIISMSKAGEQITLKKMRERYNITYQTARTDLLGLVKLGYMHKLLVGKEFFFTLDKEKCMSMIKP